MHHNRIIVVPEEEEEKKWTKKIYEENIVENFPNMGKEIVNQVQEVQRVPYRINPRRSTPRPILIKLSKFKYKEKILKATREKQQITYKGIQTKISNTYIKLDRKSTRRTPVTSLSRMPSSA